MVRHNTRLKRSSSARSSALKSRRRESIAPRVSAGLRASSGMLAGRDVYRAVSGTAPNTSESARLRCHRTGSLTEAGYCSGRLPGTRVDEPPRRRGHPIGPPRGKGEQRATSAADLPLDHAVCLRERGAGACRVHRRTEFPCYMCAQPIRLRWTHHQLDPLHERVE